MVLTFYKRVTHYHKKEEGKAWEKRLEDEGFCKDKEREIDMVIVDDENGGQERLNVFGSLRRKLIILF